MSHYEIVPDGHKPYQKDYKIPMINLVPAFVWGIPLHQKLYPNAPTWLVVALTAAFMFIYALLSLTPIIAAAPCVGSVIILTGMIWAPMDHIGNNVLRIILKIAAMVLMILLQFGIFMNATIPWIDEKTYKPTIRKVEDS
jgi:hypothetical protein